MGGGGRGIFGTILNIVSLTPFGAPLRPIALAYNTISAVQSGNPLALASSALGWNSYLSPATSAITDSSGWSSNAFDGTDAWGSPAQMAAQDFADFGSEGVSALGNSLGYAQGLDYVSPFATGFDAAASGIARTMSPDEFINSTKGYQDLSNTISQGATQAQEAVGDALAFSKQAGIAAAAQPAGELGSGLSGLEVAKNTLGDLYTVPGVQYDISSLLPQLEINTPSGYEGAGSLLGEGGKMSLSNMNQFGSTGQGIGDLTAGSTVAPGVSDPNTLAMGNTSTDAFDGTISDTTDSWGQPIGQPTQPSTDLSGSSGGLNATNSTGGLTLDPNKSGVGLTSPDGYTWSEKSFWGQPTGAGINADVGASPVGEAGKQWNSNWSWNQPKEIGEQLWDATKQHYGFGGNKGMERGQTPMGRAESLATLGSGLWSEYQHNKALKDYRSMYDRAMAASDPFASSRNIATSRWNEAAQNPDALWQQYMAGQGGLDMQEAAAKYAKAGRRNMLPQLQSQARQQFMANAYPKLMELYNPKQFPSASGQVSSAFAQGMPALTQNVGGNLMTALGKVGRGGGFGSLASLF